MATEHSIPSCSPSVRTPLVRANLRSHGIAIERLKKHTQCVNIPRRRRVTAITGVALLIMTLSACVQDAANIRRQPEAATASAEAPSNTELMPTPNCPDTILRYARDHGLLEPSQQPTDTFRLPEAQFSGTPDCYLVDRSKDPAYSAAIWLTPPENLLDAVNAALTDAGYRQSADYGPYTWWLAAETPASARHAVQYSTHPVENQLALWLWW